MLVDMAAGDEAEMHADRDWSFTADLGVRLSPVPTSRIEGVPVVQRAGRTISVDMALRDQQDRPAAHGVATFTRVKMRPGDPERPDYPVDSVGSWADDDVDLEAALMAREIADELEVDLHDTLLTRPASCRVASRQHGSARSARSLNPSAATKTQPSSYDSSMRAPTKRS